MGAADIFRVASLQGQSGIIGGIDNTPIVRLNDFNPFGTVDKTIAFDVEVDFVPLYKLIQISKKAPVRAAVCRNGNVAGLGVRQIACLLYTSRCV